VENIDALWIWLNSGKSDDLRTHAFSTDTKWKSHGINIFGLIGHQSRDITRNEAKCIAQRGPTAFDLRAILQKRDNLRATSTKWCMKQQGSQDLKLKQEDKW